MAERFRSGDALFGFGPDMTVVFWNAEAERLTGFRERDVVGSRCWEILRGEDENGSLICHSGCSGARLAREGWPVPCRRFSIKTATGRKLVTASTVRIQFPGEEPVILELLRNGSVLSDRPTTSVALTARQAQVLECLVEGLPAKVIARRLAISEVTVRNHIQAVFRALRCHSQLEAVAEARRRGLVQA